MEADRKLVINRRSPTWIYPEAICGYVQRGSKRSYIKWMDIKHAIDESQLYYSDCVLVNKLEDRKWSASQSTHETALSSAVLMTAARPKFGDDSTASKNM